MKFLFLVQGEGRGHMTQAIALQDILLKNGHEICLVCIGISKQRNIPDFFIKKIISPVIKFQSPNFIKDSHNKGILIFRSVLHNILRAPIYFKNINLLKQKVDEYNPDIIINFYDIHGGLLYLFYKLPIPYFCIAHHYYFEHPDYIYPKKKYILQKYLLKLHSYITSIRTHKKIALSYRKTINIPSKKLYISPPLLRQEILNTNTLNNYQITGYILNSGFLENILKWHNNNSEIIVTIFWDKDEERTINKNLILYKIDDRKFIDNLKKCSGYISTAGFESICEAIYLGKPVLLCPTHNHFEQECNALDAVKAGAGIIDREFNISRLLDIADNHKKNTEFVNWVHQAEDIILKYITVTG